MVPNMAGLPSVFSTEAAKRPWNVWTRGSARISFRGPPRSSGCSCSFGGGVLMARVDASAGVVSAAAAVTGVLALRMTEERYEKVARCTHDAFSSRLAIASMFAARCVRPRWAWFTDPPAPAPAPAPADAMVATPNSQWRVSEAGELGLGGGGKKEDASNGRREQKRQLRGFHVNGVCARLSIEWESLQCFALW